LNPAELSGYTEAFSAAAKEVSISGEGDGAAKERVRSERNRMFDFILEMIGGQWGEIESVKRSGGLMRNVYLSVQRKRSTCIMRANQDVPPRNPPSVHRRISLTSVL